MTVGKLVPFTGYYSMNAAPGAFLSIDTTEQYTVAAGVQKTTTIAINVSMDGKSVTTHPFSDGATFDGRTLKIPGKLTLDFTRQYNDGQVVTFSGRIGDGTVNGGTYFNPAPLSAFIGDYYDPATKKKAFSISDKEILFDFSALSKNPSGQLKAVASYRYVPAMFVLTFDNISHSVPAKFMLMLGTASQFGLACSVQDGDTPAQFSPKMLLSIL